MKKRWTTHSLYDYIVITKDQQYCGILTIRSLLITFAQIQTNIASSKNPLTHLPGNYLISEQLEKLPFQKQYSVLYIDLDQFKAYNDIYGFAKGDQVILETAHILKASISNGFIGHIGGDDFIIILDNWEFDLICNSIIQQFNNLLPSIYKKEHIDAGYVIAKNRAGIPEQLPLVSISIAVVTNEHYSFKIAEEIVDFATQIKKECKRINTSCYLTNDLVKCM